MKPYYEIKPDIKNIIIGLKEKCQELQLGNCDFTLFGEQNTLVSILELANHWEIRVTTEAGRGKRYLDIYKVNGDKLQYEFTE